MGMQTDSFNDSSPSTVVLTFGQLWQVPTFLLGLALLGGVWATRPLWYDPEGMTFQSEISKSRRAIESGAPVQDATQLLVDALEHVNQHPQQKGEVLFLLGSAYVRLAEKAVGDSSKDLWLQARRYFDQALTTGVPDGDGLEFVYRYALARFYTDASQESLKKVIDDLSFCIEKLPEERWLALGILTQAYLHSNPPNIKAALSANERQLQLPVEDQHLLDPVRLLRGELLLKTGEREEARRTLARIGDHAPAALVLRARYLRAQSFQDDRLWLEASPLWEAIIAEGQLPAAELRHVLYCLGLCYQNLHEAAKAQRIWKETLALGGEEALAAELYLAELHVQAHRFAEGLKIYERVLNEVEKPEDYRSKLVPLKAIAETLELACQEAQKAGAPEFACRLAKVYSRVVDHKRGVLMVARMAEAKANSTGDLKDYKDAGMAYEGAAAALGPGQQEGPLLWSAVKNLLSAKDYVYAESVIQHFIELKPSIDGLSEAYFRLGEIAQAQEEQKGADPGAIGQDKPTKAEESWRKCYQADGAFSGKAGVKLALALQRRGKFAEAENILEKLESLNLADSHEEAIFALAYTYYLHGLYSMAAPAWKKALGQYPVAPASLGARFQLGECYRQQAESSIAARTIESGSLEGRKLITTRATKLDDAAAEFVIVVNNLQAKRAPGIRLTDFEDDLLRRALFALADCKFARARFGEARDIYERLAADYADRIEGVEALKQLFFTYQVAIPPDPNKASETLGRMEEVLKELPDSAFAGKFDSQSREAFGSWIEKQKAELAKFNLFARPKDDKSTQKSNDQ